MSLSRFGVGHGRRPFSDLLAAAAPAALRPSDAGQGRSAAGARK